MSDSLHRRAAAAQVPDRSHGHALSICRAERPCRETGGSIVRALLGVAAAALLAAMLPGAAWAQSAPVPQPVSLQPAPGAAAGASGAGAAASAAGAIAVSRYVLPQVPPDQAQLILAAQKAAERGDPNPAQLALPQLRGTLLEPWVAYWAIKPTLTRATQADFDAFAAAYPHTYVLDRLRNDWLLELGKRQDWANFQAVYPRFIMRDDPQVMCFEQQARFATTGENTSAAVFKLWMDVPTGGIGCNSAAKALLAAGAMPRDMLWQRLRRFVADGRAKFGRDLLAPFLPAGSWRELAEADRDTARYVLGAVRRGPDAVIADSDQRQVLVLALLDMARQDPDQAARFLRDSFGALPAADRAQIWGRIGLAGALSQMPQAAGWFDQAHRADPNYAASPLVRAWGVRAGLLAGDWALVRRNTRSLIDGGDPDPDWAYWHAQALRHQGQAERARAEFAAIASPFSYYGQLALDAIGQKVSLPPSAPPADPAAVAKIAATPGLQRSLALFSLNLRSEAVREWNFTLRGFDNQQMRAAATLACEQKVWDRCINTAERVIGDVDLAQRYAMPYREAIGAAAAAQGLDEAFVYGLIRQESRFIADIRSWAGAAGLMQLMPATARLVARKIGLAGYSPDQIADVRTNTLLGSAYLSDLMQQFDGSEILSAAGYNAGPGRSRRWRQQMQTPQRPAVPGPVFVENIPIGETRHYVKVVLANATVYAALLSGQPQSLLARLGAIGPLPTQEARAP